jgi:hypothetical protein
MMTNGLEAQNLLWDADDQCVRVPVMKVSSMV